MKEWEEAEPLKQSDFPILIKIIGEYIVIMELKAIPRYREYELITKNVKIRYASGY